MLSNLQNIVKENNYDCQECGLVGPLSCDKCCQKQYCFSEHEFRTVVMSFYFLKDGRVLMFFRSDGFSAGPITESCKIDEEFCLTAIRGSREEPGIIIGKEAILLFDSQIEGQTPSGKHVRFIPCAIFLPSDFDAVEDIHLNGELSGFEILDLNEVAGFLETHAMVESRQGFRIIAGY